MSNVHTPCESGRVGILRVDATAHSTVIVCTLCGDRFLASDRAGGLRMAASHPRAVHGLPSEARDTAARARRIEARRG